MIELIKKRDEVTSTYSTKFWLCMIVFYAMFVLRSIANVSFPVVFYLAWVVVMALCFDENEIKALVISFIPLYPAFQNKYATLICLCVLIVKYFKQVKVKPFLFLGAFLMLWEVFHYNIGKFSFIEYFAGFAEVLFVMALVCIIPKKSTDVCQLSRVLAITSVVAFSILLVTTLIALDISIFQLLKLESGYRIGNLNENVTKFQRICIILFLGADQNAVKLKISNKRLIFKIQIENNNTSKYYMNHQKW